MAVPLQPNGEVIEMYFNFIEHDWTHYRPDKMRIRCSAQWQSLILYSNSSRPLLDLNNLNQPANQWAVFDLPWEPNEQGFTRIKVIRNPNDPTPNDLGAVMTGLEFGPQELQVSSSPT